MESKMLWGSCFALAFTGNKKPWIPSSLIWIRLNHGKPPESRQVISINKRYS